MKRSPITFFRRLAGCTAALALVLATLPAQAELISSNAAVAAGTGAAVSNVTTTNWSVGTYGGALKSNTRDTGQLQPFGSQLFAGGFSGTRADGLNDNYRLMPGDQIEMRLWGAIELERTLVVDSQGNVFLPSIGPMQVQGLSNGQLNSKVTAAVKSIYPENVDVYTNLLGVQPVAIFVTGFVVNPGRYAGTPNDSILYYLGQAGGIDPQTGSFRDVSVVRNSKLIATSDLYDFLLTGKMPNVQFRDGDTLVVGKRKATIQVSGEVDRDYLYEITEGGFSGADLMQLARLKAGVNHALVRGTRESGIIADYFTLGEFNDSLLADGDQIIFSADQRIEEIVVQLEGSYFGPSTFTLPRDTTLHQLLNSVAVPKELTDTQSVSIRRLSVAEQQRESLTDSLRRLETTYLGAPSATPQEAEIRVKEAELISEFVKRASEVKPVGRLVVAQNDKVIDLRLQDGDVITLPEKSESVLVSGEVLVPQSFVFTSNRNASDYIKAAGGYSQYADENKVLVVRKNGEVRSANEVTLRAGDEILVLPEVPTKNLQLATSLSQIIYQIAIAAKVAIDL